MATTPNGITYPTVGDSVTPLASKFATLATTADAAITAVANALRGNFASIPAAGVEGRTYYSVDTNVTYFDTGSAWIIWTTDWQAITPASGWSAGPSPACRIFGGYVEVLPGEWTRTTNLTVSAGSLITVGTLPTGFRPATGTQTIGSGAIGVAGNLGASRWFASSTGNLQFMSLVSTGTMSTGGGVGNSLVCGRLQFATT